MFRKLKLVLPRLSRSCPRNRLKEAGLATAKPVRPPRGLCGERVAVVGCDPVERGASCVGAERRGLASHRIAPGAYGVEKIGVCRNRGGARESRGTSPPCRRPQSPVLTNVAAHKTWDTPVSIVRSGTSQGSVARHPLLTPLVGRKRSEAYLPRKLRCQSHHECGGIACGGFSGYF